MGSMDFEWDAGNITEIGKHRLSPAEIEEVLKDPRSHARPPYVRQGELRWFVLGPTSEGRILVVVWTPRSGRIRVVTAYPAPPPLRREFGEGQT